MIQAVDSRRVLNQDSISNAHRSHWCVHPTCFHRRRWLGDRLIRPTFHSMFIEMLAFAEWSFIQPICLDFKQDQEVMTHIKTIGNNMEYASDWRFPSEQPGFFRSHISLLRRQKAADWWTRGGQQTFFRSSKIFQEGFLIQIGCLNEWQVNIWQVSYFFLFK